MGNGHEKRDIFENIDQILFVIYQSYNVKTCEVTPGYINGARKQWYPFS